MSGRPVRDLFIKINGYGPWPCFFCGELVFEDEQDSRLILNVHHKNEVRTDNRLGNLKPSHQGCHTRYHARRRPGSNTGKRFTEEHKRKIGLAHKGKKVTQESRKKLSETIKGRPWSEARREADKARKKDPRDKRYNQVG